MRAARSSSSSVFVGSRATNVVGAGRIAGLGQLGEPAATTSSPRRRDAHECGPYPSHRQVLARASPYAPPVDTAARLGRSRSSSPISPTASPWRGSGRTICRSTTKPDLTPVSEADHAVERAIRDRLAGDDRSRGARRGVRRRSRRGRRRVPLDHRPDRRHEELRARRADLGDAHRPRTRGRARRRRRVARPRSACGGGPAAGLGAFRDGERIERRRRSRRSTTRSCRSRGTPRSAFTPTASASKLLALVAPVLAHARHRRLLAAHARRRRRVRHRDRSDRVPVGRRGARSRSSRRRAGGGRTLDGRDRCRRAAASCARTVVLHEEVIAALA